jgi:regulatory protein
LPAPKKLDSEGLWNYALRALARRPHSFAELRSKLNLRTADRSIVPPVMEKLREYGFADDQKFSQTFATARLQNDGFGRSRVLRDLRAKRVPGDVAAQAVAQTFEGTSEDDLIARFIERRFRGKDLTVWLLEEKNLASAYRRLRVAGFSSTRSLAALKRYKADLPDWDEPEESAESD